MAVAGCGAAGMLGPVSSPDHTAWRSRVTRACACVLLVLCLVAAGAPLAWSATGSSASEGQAFSELSKAGQEETTQTQKTETTTSTTPVSNSKKTVIIIIVAAVALLVAIAYVIVRDARNVAPSADPQVAEARSAHDAAATLRKRRAKAKAARRQRKQNSKRRR
jgi:hypothetical protein